MPGETKAKVFVKLNYQAKAEQNAYFCKLTFFILSVKAFNATVKLFVADSNGSGKEKKDSQFE